MHKNFETNRTKIKCGCQSGRKVVTHNSKSDLTLVHTSVLIIAEIKENRAEILCPGKAL